MNARLIWTKLIFHGHILVFFLNFKIKNMKYERQLVIIKWIFYLKFECLMLYYLNIYTFKIKYFKNVNSKMINELNQIQWLCNWHYQFLFQHVNISWNIKFPWKRKRNHSFNHLVKLSMINNKRSDRWKINLLDVCQNENVIFIVIKKIIC